MALMQEPYSYELPPDRIAQRPVYPYDRARLLTASRSSGAVAEGTFRDLPGEVRAGDVFVFNDTRVIPARLFGRLAATGGGVEILLVTAETPLRWRVIGRPLRKFRPGVRLSFPGGLLGEVIERIGEHEAIVHFSGAADRDIPGLIRQAGVMPIPPYIRGGRADEADERDYQTIFAREEGSVAAPTASLHFTPELMAALAAAGCEMETVTLHVGAPSFTALWAEGESAGALTPPGAERYGHDPELLARLRAVRTAGRRVVAVGTTVVRALESMARDEGAAGWRETSLFISPGFTFEVVDALVTNFHLPRSTHLLLVEAFAGRALLEASYAWALEHDFRFFSYGDGMLIT